MTEQKKSSGGGNRKGAGKYLHFDRNKPFDCPQSDFKAAMDAAGLQMKEIIIPDGKLYRAHIEGDRPGSKNGWYVLYGEGLPAGSFGSWKTGFKSTWCAKAEGTLSAAERKEYGQRMIEARKAREAEERARRNAAKEKAIAIWKASPPATDNHPYLVKKGVHNHGLRLYKGALVVPLRDSEGNLHSLQFIDGEGNKRFLSGGRIQGCHYIIGTPGDTLCICEGYATGATIYEQTGYAVAVAFNCGNLLSVARAVRKKFPDIKIILCADNDKHTPGNPGLTTAREAAAACGASLAVPPCAGDFNDLYKGLLK